MLKNIPSIISPELLKQLDLMGHGDRVIIADANFPSLRVSNNVVRLDGCDGVSVLEAVLTLIPIDTRENSVCVMAVEEGDNVKTPIWEDYKKACQKDKAFKAFTELSRNEFYNQAKEAFLIIQTTEKALYANIMLQKGCI